MKRFLSGLCLLAVASVGMAQMPQIPATYPMVQPMAQPTGQPIAGSYPLYANPGTPSAAAPYMQSGLAYPYNPGCGPECCVPMTKVCVPEPAIKTITHTCYSKTCAEFCYPKCSCCLASLFGCCNACPGCDGPYTKYFLIKKVRIEECPTFKCVPTEVPACGPIAH